MASSESVNDFFKQQTLEEPKLVQLYKGLWFTAMHSKGKSTSGPVIIEKTKYLYDEMQITDRCTSSQGSNEKLPARNLIIHHLSSAMGTQFELLSFLYSYIKVIYQILYLFCSTFACLV